MRPVELFLADALNVSNEEVGYEEKYEVSNDLEEIRAFIKENPFEHCLELQGLLLPYRTRIIDSKAMELKFIGQNLREKEIDRLYSYGYEFYKMGQWDEAYNFFLYGAVSNIRDYKTVFALAQTLEKKELYALAIEGYLFAAANSDFTLPEPLYRAVNCYEQLGDIKGAILMYQCVIEICEFEETNEILAIRSKLQLEMYKACIEKGNLEPLLSFTKEKQKS